MLDHLRAIEPHNGAELPVVSVFLDHEVVHDQQVVDGHSANYQHDDPDVDQSDYTVDRVGGDRRRRVRIAGGERRVRIFMTLPTGRHDVGRVDARGRVRGGKHQVRRMAAHAGRRRFTSNVNSPAVITVLIGTYHTALHTVLGNDLGIVMARPACLNGQIGRIDSGARVTV